MRKNLLVSVLVAAYKEENLIIDCLESIKAQTYKEIELVIIDDCSPDNTYNVALEWVNNNKERFVDTTVIRNVVNLGISKNFNKLVRSATGEYLKIIAADDMLLPEAIEQESDYLKTNSDEIVFANCVIIDEKYSYPIELNGNEKKKFDESPKSGTQLLEHLMKNDFIPAPTVMFRKSTFDKYGLFREDLVFEDWEYWLRLTSRGCSIGYLNRVIVAYRVWSGGFSQFERGIEAERRYVKNIQSQEIILDEYSRFIDGFDLSIFWNSVVSTCMELNYKDTLYDILDKKKFKKNMLVKMKIILFNIHLYKPVFAIIHYIKNRKI